VIALPMHRSVDFRVGRADAVAEGAGAFGGTVMMPPFDSPGFRNAVVRDAQGAVFSISEPRL
jgi:hypothetical protein